MKIEIPVLIQRFSMTYLVRPVFDDSVCMNDSDEKKALFFFVQELQRKCVEYQQDSCWDQILRFAGSSHLRTQHVKLYIDILGKYYKLDIQVVLWKESGVTYVLIPFLDSFCFALPPDHDIDYWLEILMKNWARKQTARIGKEDVYKSLDNLSHEPFFWLSKVFVTIPDSLMPAQSVAMGPKSLFERGRETLDTSGRAVFFIPASNETSVLPPYNEKLSAFRDLLYQSLTGRDRKAVLVLGPDRIGKTRMIEQTLVDIDRDFNYSQPIPGLWEQNKEKKLSAWRLTPGRLVSGMTRIGDWESRVQALFYYAHRTDSIYWFDQFPALTETGKSSSGSLSVADLLAQALKQRQFRAIVEVTREQLHLIREKNRSLIEQFEVLAFPVLDDQESLEIYVASVQRLESQFNCRFDASVIPMLARLCRSYEPMSGQPGTVCLWLEKLASRFRNSIDPIDSDVVLDAYQAKTGLSMSIYKNENMNERSVIEMLMSERIIGQPKAVEAMADCCIRAENLFTDPARPLASLLFLGPTGTGKTESAKELARYLYGSEKRLIRFDANELTTSYAVSRLIGSVSQEGTLTSAVRLQPFCVILFDEIEKGHPTLCDLLLQVLGEGRLTDGKGRLVSFTQCMIVMTSNLGSKSAGRFAGFGSAHQEDESVYMKAVRDFFRPEWINRIDKIIPFNLLDERSLQVIAERFLSEIKSREGFQRRKCLVYFTSRAKDWLVRQGHDVQFGARQTLRSLERELVEPIARFWAQNQYDNASILEIDFEPNRAEPGGSEFGGSEFGGSEPNGRTDGGLSEGGRVDFSTKNGGVLKPGIVNNNPVAANESRHEEAAHIVLSGHPLKMPDSDPMQTLRENFCKRVAQLSPDEIESRFRATFNRYRKIVDRLSDSSLVRISDYKNMSLFDSMRLLMSELFDLTLSKLQERLRCDSAAELSAYPSDSRRRLIVSNKGRFDRDGGEVFHFIKLNISDWERILSTEYGFLPPFDRLTPVQRPCSLAAEVLEPLLSLLFDLEYLFHEGELREQTVLVLYFSTDDAIPEFWERQTDESVPHDRYGKSRQMPLFCESLSNASSWYYEDLGCSSCLPELTFEPGFYESKSDSLSGEERILYAKVSGIEALRRMKSQEGTTLILDMDSRQLIDAGCLAVWEFVSEDETPEQAISRWRKSRLQPNAPSLWSKVRHVCYLIVNGCFWSSLQTSFVIPQEWADLTADAGVAEVAADATAEFNKNAVQKDTGVSGGQTE